MLKQYYNRSLNTPYHSLLGLLTGQASVCYSDASIAMFRSSKHLSTSATWTPRVHTELRAAASGLYRSMQLYIISSTIG